MRIGLYGIGNISQKAYLPIISQKMDEVDWIISSRSPEKMHALQKKYGFVEGYTTLDEMIESHLTACLVQSPTPTHYQVIKKLLLNGIHVFVDKPVSDNWEETQELYELARSQNCLLFVGFNRRYSPALSEILMDIKDVTSIYSYKHRINQPQEVRFAIYDLFIHPLDTALYSFSDKPVTLDSISYQLKEEKLHHLSVVLKSENCLATVAMNLVSGSNREAIELHSPAKTVQLENLEFTTIFQNSQSIVRKFSDWDTTLYKRGFEPLLTSFLEAVKNNQLPEEQRNTIESHAICEQIISYIEANK